MNTNVVGVTRDSLSQLREESGLDRAHLPGCGGILTQEVLEVLPFGSPRRCVEPEVKIQIVHARVQCDVEDRREAADGVREATNGVFKRLGWPADFGK